MSSGRLHNKGQLNTSDVADGARAIDDLISLASPDIIVMESYRVYAWKAKTHAWAGLHTPRLIGGVEVIANLRRIPLVQQSAHEAKTFCTDEKLEEWNLWQTGMRHANDAIRHACYAFLFSKSPIFGRGKNED